MFGGTGGTSRPLLAAFGALAVLAGLVTGCTDDGDDPAPAGASATPSTTVEPLSEAWRTDTGVEAIPTSLVFADRYEPWVDGERYAVVGDHAVAVLDTTSGEVVSTVRLPAGLTACQVSLGLSDAGVGGVLLRGRGKEAPCATVAVVDTRAGRLLWSAEVGRQRPDIGAPTVSVGRRVVVVTVACGETRRWRVRDGRELRPLLLEDRKCAHSAVHDGRYVVAFDDPVSARTPDGVDGWIPAVPGEGALELYDQDSGRLLWRRPDAGLGADLAALVSDDPLVVQESRDGHDLLQAYDDRGRPSHVVGQPLGYGTGTLRVYGVEDGRLVVSYPRGVASGAVFSYDLATGTEQAHVSFDRWTSPLALQGGGLLVQRSGWGRDGAALVGRVDLDTGAERVLGSVDLGFERLAVVGDRMLVANDEEVVAYDLPSADHLPDVDDLEPPDVVARLDGELPWEEGEVRPDTEEPLRTDAACQQVSAGTLELLAFRRTDLQPPSDCRWSETQEPSYATRGLSVTTSVSEPVVTWESGSGSEEPEAVVESTATQVAEQGFADAVSETPEWGSWRPLPGFGDAARLATVTSRSAQHSEVALVVRVRNVVVRVEGTQEARVEDRGAAVVPRHVLQAGVLAAATDVLAALDLDVTAPTAEPGAVTAVPDVCTVLGPAARSFTGLRAQDVTPATLADDSMHGCVWWSEDDEARSMVATAYAVPGDPDGTDAAEVARQILGEAGDARKVRLGDAGVLWAYDSDQGDYRSRDLYARKGNVVVSVEMTDPESSSASDLEARVLAAGRALLRAAT